MKKLPLLFILCFWGFGINHYHAQPYFKWYDSIKVKTDVSFIDNPWAGGLNFVQVSNIDLDMDGVKDLFVFDRTGDKIRTFLKKGNAGTVSYQYAPSYEKKFPAITEWVLLNDYNCDGKGDIFCYSSVGGGFDVYKNISTLSTGLQFQKVVTQQLSAYFPDAPPTSPCSLAKRCNLYVSPVDIPAFSDIDNDGDLDVVTFDIVSGSHMVYHKNMSRELYQSCDSLIFQVANHCWGYATEHALTNDYTLHDTCIDNVNNPQLVPDEAVSRRHSGSCELCVDLDADGDKDFVVGDISFNNLTMLTNGGTPTNANFTKIDVAFPASNGSNVPVNMTIFPCPFFVDVNGDGKRDLLVSPNAPNNCENFTSLSYYKNTGADNAPIFEFVQGNLLQDQMIDLGEGAYPVFFDYNNDGLLDLFIGNYGYYNQPTQKSKLALFRNTGTLTSPRFELITRDYADLSAMELLNIVPTFGDLDGDGDADMIIGDYRGNLSYFQNKAPAGAEAQFLLLKTELPHGLNNRTIDVGDFATPQIIDMDHDGKNDLVIGARNGKLAYYHNNGKGTSVPSFDSITHFLGEVSITKPGYFSLYAHPFIFKDKSGVTKMLVGSLDGYLNLYEDIDNNLGGKFKLVDKTYQDIFQGTRTAPSGADIDNDGYMDLIVGNYQGGVSFYKGVSKNIIGIDAYDPFLDFNFELFPNPATNSVTIRINDEHNSLFLLEVYNLMGQYISGQVITNNRLTLDTQAMEQGMYLYKVYEVDNNHVKKTGALIKRLIVQH